MGRPKQSPFKIVKRKGRENLYMFCSLPDPIGRQRICLYTNNHQEAQILAEAKYNQLLHELNGIENDITISEATDLFLENHSISKKSYSEDLNKRKPVLEYFGASTPLTRIKKAEIDGFKVWLKKTRQISGATINRYLAFLKSVFNYAIDNELFDKVNPVSKVKFNPESSRKEYFTQEQINQIIGLCWEMADGADPTNPKQQYRFYLPVFVLLLSITGARGSEILNLKWADIGDDHIILKKTKTSDDRMVGFDNDIVTKIKSYCPKTSIFLFDIQKRKPNSFRHWLHIIQEKMGLSKNYRFHTFRHSYGTYFGETQDPKTVQITLGHKSLNTTSRYTHSIDTFKKQKEFSKNLVPNPLGSTLIPDKKITVMEPKKKQA